MPKKHIVTFDPPFKSPLKLFISLMLPFLARVAGSFVSNASLSDWYESLNKPAINPPNWLFAPVWTLLYVFMGLSLYLVWTNNTKHKRKSFAVWLYLIHLVVNSLWSIVFFGWLNIGMAFVVILTLWVLIAILIIIFAKIDKRASALLVPYLLWVSYATYLNYEFLRLN